MIRVLLADDQALVRAGFKVLIGSDRELEVVGEAGNGREAYDIARRLSPDVVLMDIRMPDVDGLEATEMICSDAALEATRVLILTTFETDEYVFKALRAGASGFLLKDTEPAELLAGIRVVANGESLLAPSVTRLLIEEVLNGNSRAGQEPTGARAVDIERLTEREKEVLLLVAAGLSNDEIAKSLYVSPLTAKTHVSRILTKLGARDRAQLVVIAYETGLVSPGGRSSRA